MYFAQNATNLLGAGVFGDSLGTFRDGVLGQFTGEEQTDCGLDFPGGDGGATVVVCQAGSLSGDTLEDVVHERVHDRHGLAGDSSVGVHLLQHFVDVDRVRLPPPPLAFLVTSTYRKLNCILFQVVYSRSIHKSDMADARYAFKGVHKWFALSFTTL